MADADARDARRTFAEQAVLSLLALGDLGAAEVEREFMGAVWRLLDKGTVTYGWDHKLAVTPTHSDDTSEASE